MFSEMSSSRRSRIRSSRISQKNNMTNRRDFLKAAAVGLPLLAASDVSAQNSIKAIYKKPVVVSTWDSGIRANAAGWPILQKGGHALDAIETKVVTT